VAEASSIHDGGKYGGNLKRDLKGSEETEKKGKTNQAQRGATWTQKDTTRTPQGRVSWWFNIRIRVLTLGARSWHSCWFQRRWRSQPVWRMWPDSWKFSLRQNTRLDNQALFHGRQAALSLRSYKCRS